ncbi:30 kDa heat shock protein [Erysiphe neolycopersici]|uniref:30 kDa heat shock protein n=1 Tax=Erysiphe neolycopersici TaxID=212602 RepID=A0A420H763_9PEZI|nr:30 kDa heat shock protein [Erysiphe neolycopersici]
MALFPRSYITNDQSAYPPIIRLLNEFDNYSRGVDRPSQFSSNKSFTPKFDIKELPESYQLFGELPGIEQKDIEIEFTDASTLTIKGSSERSYTDGFGSDVSKEKDKKKEDKKEIDSTFWVLERSVGEFSRSFGFPVPVDQELVKASLKNGILSVIVPKAKKQESRKITIQ